MGKGVGESGYVQAGGRQGSQGGAKGLKGSIPREGLKVSCVQWALGYKGNKICPSRWHFPLFNFCQRPEGTELSRAREEKGVAGAGVPSPVGSTQELSTISCLAAPSCELFRAAHPPPPSNPAFPLLRSLQASLLRLHCSLLHQSFSSSRHAVSEILSSHSTPG